MQCSAGRPPLPEGAPGRTCPLDPMHLRPRDSTECRSNDDSLYAIGSGGHVLTRPCGPHDRVKEGRSFTGDSCFDPSEGCPHITTGFCQFQLNHCMQGLCVGNSKPGVNSGALKSKNRTCPNLDALSVPEALVHSIQILVVPAVCLVRLWPR